MQLPALAVALFISPTVADPCVHAFPWMDKGQTDENNGRPWGEVPGPGQRIMPSGQMVRVLRRVSIVDENRYCGAIPGLPGPCWEWLGAHDRPAMPGSRSAVASNMCSA